MPIILVNLNDFQNLSDFFSLKIRQDLAQLSKAKPLSLKIGLDLAHLIRAKSEKFGDTPRKFYLAGVPL